MMLCHQLTSWKLNFKFQHSHDFDFEKCRWVNKAHFASIINMFLFVFASVAGQFFQQCRQHGEDGGETGTQ